MFILVSFSDILQYFKSSNRNYILFAAKLLKKMNKKNDMKRSSKGGLAGRYNLIKGSQKKLSPFCTLYQTYNVDTNQVWHAKVFNNQQVKNYGMNNCLQYNMEVLQQCQEMENIICMKQIFSLSGSTFIIQEKYDQSLLQLINESYPCNAGAIQDILCDVLSGLLQIYQQKYFTRNLRVEHIVCVDDVWKIQSFVLDSKIHVASSEFAWSPEGSSLEDRAKESELPEEQIDEQLVWNLGIIGLQMVLGPNFAYSKINNDVSIPWNKVKDSVSMSMFDFLKKALKTNFKQRIKLKDLLAHEMFAHLGNSKSHPFLSFQKFFGNHSQKSKNSKQQKAILNKQDQQNLNNLKDDIQRFKYFGQVERYIQELPFKNNFDINLIRYLSFKISHYNLVKINNEIQVWKRQNDAVRVNEQVKNLESDLENFLLTIKQNKVKCSKNIKGFQMAKSEVPQIKNVLDYEINDDNIMYSQVVNLYMRLSGSIYSLMARQCDGIESSNKERTVCYYSLGAYLVHFYQTDKFSQFSEYKKNGVLELSTIISKVSTNELINLTQKLIKLHFATN